MRIIADENVPAATVARLRSAGLDVEWVAISMPGASDRAILSRADIVGAVLITLDRDFGELIFRSDLPRPLCVLYSRLGRVDPRYLADRLIALLSEGAPEGELVTLRRDEDRRRRFDDGAELG